MSGSLTELELETWLIERLTELKYTVRDDIRDRAALEARVETTSGICDWDSLTS